MLGHGGSSAGSHLADPTSPIPFALCCDYPVSKCPSASIVVTSTFKRYNACEIYSRIANDRVLTVELHTRVISMTREHTYILIANISEVDSSADKLTFQIFVHEALHCALYHM